MSETPEKRSEWRSPQVIAPIIAAVCTVLVAVIGLVSNQIRLNQAPVATIVVTVVPATEMATGESLATPLAATPVPDVVSASTTEAESGAPNVTLFYDEDSFTIWNNTDSTVSLAEVSFRSNGEPRDMSIWGSMADALPAKKCLRLRDANTRKQDPPDACAEAESIHGYFEVGSSNVYWRDTTAFEVVRDEEVIATCQMAAEMCEIYVAQ